MTSAPSTVETAARTAVVDDQADDAIRARIRADLPPDTFTPRPWRALLFVPFVGVAVASMWTIIALDTPWYLSLVLALVIGQCIASLGFLAHDAMHGGMMKSRRMQDLLGYIGFGPVLVSPTLWRTWHNQVHHNRTNAGNPDPDSFGTLERYQRAPSTRIVARLAPGSGHWYSAFFFSYWFTFHGQVVLWIQSKYLKTFRGLNRRRAIVDTFAFAAAWAVVGWLAGPVAAIFVILIPMIVANATVMGYIATNHFMRPQSTSNDPLVNSMSVTSPKVVDLVHNNFSYHVEHHLFPRMSPSRAPRVRQWLKTNEATRYVAPPHWLAVSYLYRTPRVYLDATTLCDPDNPDRRMSTDDIALALS